MFLIRLMKNKLLVIIDDEEDILDLLKYNFGLRGFDVVVFSRAEPAWEYIHTRTPSVILCDWMMPGMDGLEFCKKMKNDRGTSGIPLIMVTCKSDKSAKQSALDGGAIDYIVKPVKINELIQKVEKLVAAQA